LNFRRFAVWRFASFRCDAEFVGHRLNIESEIIFGAPTPTSAIAQAAIVHTGFIGK
jgi:hypothetical protein